MFNDIRQLRALMASLFSTCTASATPGSHDSLVNSVCYDSQGCCNEAADGASAHLTFADSYTSCLDANDNAVAKLACSG
jgi:hypothetical protein